jgi:leader peptidase (prepilin peptidase)/N-methyltransferase
MSFLLTVTLFSLLIGSFLNVVIYRLPKILEQGWKQECREFLSDELSKKPPVKQQPLTLSTPASSCPHCQQPIRFYQNIPLLSWLFLRGKCAHCQHKISVRYPLVELTTGLLSLAIAYLYGVSLLTLFLLILTWALICLTLIDFDHMILPDQITLPILWLGLLVNLNGLIVPLDQAVIGAVSGYLSLYSVFWLFKLATGKEGMGHGDFKLFALFGAWLGWQLLPLLILMASAVGATVGISLILFKKHQRQQVIPFGPYLAISGWICLIWGEGIWQWYLQMLT